MPKLSEFPTLAAAIRDAAREAIEEILGGSQEETADEPRSDRVRDRDSDRESHRPATRSKARRSPIGRKGSRVEYVTVRGRHNDGDLFSTARKVWREIVKHEPTTAEKIEKATKLPKKTVESCVWHLRNIGWIKSREIR